MLSTSNEEFLYSLSAAKSSEAIWLLTEKRLSDIGITHWNYLIANTKKPESLCLRSSLPQFWIDHYRDRQFHRLDPFFRYCCDGFAPFKIGPDYLDKYQFLSSEERRYILEAGETGFRSGTSATVRVRRHGDFGGWNFGNTMKRADFEKWLAVYGSELHLLAFSVHENLRNIASSNRRLSGDISLSPREYDCLLWLARGLRNSAIAEQMGIAEVTVELHLRNARKKLGASTREQALAKAIMSGEILP